MNEYYFFAHFINSKRETKQEFRMSKVGVKSQLGCDIKLFMGIQHGHKSDMETPLKKRIGSGSFDEVYEGVDTQTDERIA